MCLLFDLLLSTQEHSIKRPSEEKIKLIETRMDLGKVVHMNGGDGETSYAKNSFHQVCMHVCVCLYIYI